MLLLEHTLTVVVRAAGVNDKPSFEVRVLLLTVLSEAFCDALRRETSHVLKGALISLASVHSLSPVTSSAQDDSISELLRFL